MKPHRRLWTGLALAFACALLGAPHAFAAATVIRSGVTTKTGTVTTSGAKTSLGTATTTAAETEVGLVDLTDTELGIEAAKIEEQALQDERRLLDRLAAEFGVSAAEMQRQKTELDVSWGDLVIAHTLAASSDPKRTIQQLLVLRGAGQGWGTIAQDMGLNLGQAVSAVRQETMVANGTVRADGHAQAIARGTGVRADVGTTTRASRAGSTTRATRGVSSATSTTRAAKPAATRAPAPSSTR
jgi:hypothetical protein